MGHCGRRQPVTTHTLARRRDRHPALEPAIQPHSASEKMLADVTDLLDTLPGRIMARIGSEPGAPIGRVVETAVADVLAELRSAAEWRAR